MMTLIASLLGLIGGALPDVMRIFQDGRDKKHELELLKIQVEAADRQHQQRLEEVGLQADVAEATVIHQRGNQRSGITWIDALNGTVRPTLAYGFFLLYVYIKVNIVLVSDLPWQLWTDFDEATLAGVITYYFGQRAFHKVYGRGK